MPFGYVLRTMRWNFMPLGKEYLFGQVLRAMRWNFMLLGKKYPEHTLFGECSGQEPRLCFCFVKYLLVPLLTQCPPRRVLVAGAAAAAAGATGADLAPASASARCGPFPTPACASAGLQSKHILTAK
jgi:hypothetical protein